MSSSAFSLQPVSEEPCCHLRGRGDSQLLTPLLWGCLWWPWFPVLFHGCLSGLQRGYIASEMEREHPQGETQNLPSCVVFHHPSSVSGVRCLVLGSGPSVPAFLQSTVVSPFHLLSHLQSDSNSCQLFTQSITWVPLKPLKPMTWSAHSFHIIPPSAVATLVAFDSHYVISIMETLFPLPGFCFLCVFSWPPPLGFNVVSSQRDIILLHIREIETDQQILPSPSLFLFHPSNRMPERAVQTAEFRLVEVSG